MAPKSKTINPKKTSKRKSEARTLPKVLCAPPTDAELWKDYLKDINPYTREQLKKNSPKSSDWDRILQTHALAELLSQAHDIGAEWTTYTQMYPNVPKCPEMYYSLDVLHTLFSNVTKNSTDFYVYQGIPVPTKEYKSLLQKFSGIRNGTSDVRAYHESILFANEDFERFVRQKEVSEDVTITHTKLKDAIGVSQKYPRFVGVFLPNLPIKLQQDFIDKFGKIAKMNGFKVSKNGDKDAAIVYERPYELRLFNGNSDDENPFMLTSYMCLYFRKPRKSVGFVLARGQGLRTWDT